MEYRIIKRKKLYEEVAEAIVEMIRNGTLKSGDKLDSVQQLSESFQVSRSAIREAQSALRAMGLIEIRQGEGTYVKKFDPKVLTIPVDSALLMKKMDVENLLEVRKILEAGAADAAANKRLDNDLKKIKHALDEMKKANGNEELGEKADFLFHLAIAEATKNELLVSLMNNVSEMMVRTMKETRRLWFTSNELTLNSLYNEHKEIYEAIKNKDRTLARTLMLKHLDRVEKSLLEYSKIK